MRKGRVMVSLHLNGKQVGRGNTTIKLALVPDSADELASKALGLALSPEMLKAAAERGVLAHVSAETEQTIYQKFGQAKSLLMAASGRLDATELDSAGDTLAFKILEFLQHN